MMPEAGRIFIIAITFLCLIFSGCGKKEETVIENIPGTETGSDGEVTEITLSDPKGEGEAEEASAPEKFLIEQKDADMLLNEAISGTDCKAVFKETVEIEDKGYYTYAVTDPDGNDLKEMLAVDGFSGEVHVYDPEKKSVTEFKTFSFYEKSSAREKDIDWDGRFVLDNYSIELVPADEASFEFTVSKKKEEIVFGLAHIKGDKAHWESEDGKDGIDFKMVDENTLQLVETGGLRLSGQYIRE